MENDCLFCKIVRGEIPSAKLYEDDDVIAFKDISPQAPVHFLVIPKNHIPSLMDIKADHTLLMGKLLVTGERLAQNLGLGKSGARFVFNCKEDAGQTVPHVHLHVLGGKPMGWPPFPPPPKPKKCSKKQKA